MKSKDFLKAMLPILAAFVVASWTLAVLPNPFTAIKNKTA